jgi:hypothetical protein
LYENSPKSVTISLCGKLGCGRRRRCLASASEVEPNGAANGEGGEGGEGEPEAAGAEARRSGPEEAELGTEAEEDKAITATHIGTAHSNMSTNVSAIEGRLRNSTTSKNGSSILPEVSDKMRPDLHGPSTREGESLGGVRRLID